jgi:hypothetical protein
LHQILINTMKTNPNSGVDTGVVTPLPVTFQDQKFTWNGQYATGKELKNLFGVPTDQDLYLSLTDPWDDQVVTNEMVIDLARPGVEKFYLRLPLEYRLDDKKLSWDKPFITGLELRQIGRVEVEDEIWLKIPKPYSDELVKNESRIDLTRPDVEQFYVVKAEVVITINATEHKVKRGTYSVAQLKKVGNVKAADELDQIKSGHVLVPLEDDASVEIKGGEQFVSHKRDGSSS